MATGCSPLRQRETPSGPQFWYTEPTDRVVCGKSLEDIAENLGIKEKAVSELSSHRAASITGYSISTISRAVKAGELKVSSRKGRAMFFTREEVLRWADSQKQKGAIFAPRPRRRKPRDPRRLNHIQGHLSHTPDVTVRLGRYLDNLKGTPFEMTREEFVARVVTQALDKLEK